MSACGQDLMIDHSDPPDEPLPETAFVLGAVGLLCFVFFSIMPIVVREFRLGLPSLALSGISLYAWLRHHRWIRTRTLAARTILATGCWVWPLWLAMMASLLKALGILSSSSR